ncbi:hypothetical protein NKJ59_26950 [Mesorhizobium australicum]|uniref:hypothetical protein n=1 Tax=Mesorhizobium australicum TaxID=536018 RepID=UPI00333B8545
MAPGIGRGAGVCSELASRDRFAAFQPASSSSPVSSSWMERDFSRRALICAISTTLAFDSKPWELYDPEDGTTSDRHQFSFIFSAEGR